MSDLAQFAYLWDGSAPEWVIARIQGEPLFPLNTATDQGFSIVDGEPLLMERILERMQSAGRPWMDYVEWDVQRTTTAEVLRSIERISQRVWRIRTRPPRDLSIQAQEISAPLKNVQARLESSHDHMVLLQAARTVWSIHLELLAFERRHHL